MHQYTVVSLAGYQGSGKTTLGKKLANHLRTSHYETSSVVKEVHGELERKDLASTSEQTKTDPNWLGKALKEHLKAAFQFKPVAVVTGIREYEVIHYLKRFYNVVGFEVIAPPEIRFERVLKQGKVTNAIEFLEHELKEKELGLDNVLCDSPHFLRTSNTTDPDKIVKAIVKKLLDKGYKLR